MLRDKRNMMEGKRHLVLCFDKTLITKELKFMADAISSIIRTASVNKNQEKAKDEVITKLVAATTENIYTALHLDDLSRPHVIAPLTEDSDLDSMILGSPVNEAIAKFGEHNVYRDEENNLVVVPVTLKKVSTDVINAKNKAIQKSIESDGVVMESVDYGALENEKRMCDNVTGIDYTKLHEKLGEEAKADCKKIFDGIEAVSKKKKVKNVKPVVGKKVAKIGREKDTKAWAEEFLKPTKKTKKEKK